MRAGLSQGQALLRLPGAGMLPGLVLCAALAALGFSVSQTIGVNLLGLPKSPVSPTVVAILLGIALRNFTVLPESFDAGIHFTLGAVLKLGIALLGVRLSLGMVAEIGLQAVPIVIACIATALILVTRLSRWLGISSRLGTLIAVGTSICGATAIAATAPCIRAKGQEVCYAIGCVALFGLLAMLAYPWLANWLFDGSSLQSGLFLGTAVHDTAQVIGAGLAYEQFFNDAHALNTATVTKLLRNLSMLLVIPLLTLRYRRDAESSQTETTTGSLIPLFIVAFVGLSLARTVGDMVVPSLGALATSIWDAGIGYADQLALVCLTMAMAAVGLGTRFAVLRKLGVMPFTMGMTAAVIVGVVSVVLIRAFYA